MQVTIFVSLLTSGTHFSGLVSSAGLTHYDHPGASLESKSLGEFWTQMGLPRASKAVGSFLLIIERRFALHDIASRLRISADKFVFVQVTVVKTCNQESAPKWKRPRMTCLQASQQSDKCLTLPQNDG